MSVFEVTAEAQIQEILEWALADGKTLSVCGQNSKSAFGRPMQTDAQLSLKNLQGVEMYEPAELVMKAKAGSRLVDIAKALDERGQQLAFAPPDYGPLLGGVAGQATLGGVFACNLSGSSRIKAGAARDHLLGVQGFTGRAQPFQAGSRVMKNVTGYDLCKIITGSYGTLAVCTDFTFKVLPKPEKARTVLVYGEEVSAAVNSMRDAMSSIHEISATAYLPQDIAARANIDFVSDAGYAVTAILVEGPSASAEFRCSALRDAFQSRGRVEELHGMRSAKFWSFVANAQAYVADQSTQIWRVSIPPASASDYIAAVQETLPELDYYLDWAGGLIWLSLPASVQNAGADAVRGCLNGNGHATLIRAPENTRGDVGPFQPQNSVLSRISENIREGFDPSRILNPGRMYPFE